MYVPPAPWYGGYALDGRVDNVGLGLDGGALLTGAG